MALLPAGNDMDQAAAYNWDSVGALLTNILQIALTIASFVAAIYIIWGAIQYFTAYGSEEKATAAKNTLLSAFVGIIIIMLGKLIIAEVWNFVTPGGGLNFWI